MGLEVGEQLSIMRILEETKAETEPSWIGRGKKSKTERREGSISEEFLIFFLTIPRHQGWFLRVAERRKSTC